MTEPLAVPARRELSAGDLATLLQHQSRVLERLVAGTPMPEVLSDLVLAVEDLLPGSLCSVLLFDEASATLRHGAAPSLPDAYNRAIHGMAIGPKAGSCGTAAYRRESVVVGDIATDPLWDDFRHLALPHGLRSCWSSPILIGGTKLVGTFALYQRRPYVPGPRDVQLIERVTHLAAVTLEHERLYGELAESEERFRRSFDENAAGMALLDLDGRYLRVNAALCDILGRREPEVLRLTVRETTHPEDVAGLDGLERLRRGEAWSGHAIERIIRPSGEAIWVTTTTTVVRDASGGAHYLCQNVLDITERQRAETEHRKRLEAEMARATAEDASRAKSEFLSELSHELRTPLSSIVGYVELLRSLDLPARRRTAALDAIAESGELIRALVDDLLDLAGIESGVTRVDLRPVALEPLVADVLRILRPLALGRGVHLRPLRRRARGTLVHADPVRLRQVVLNLVSNAVKYNRPGGSVHLAIRTPSADGVELRVSDTGVGIPAAAWDRLFQPYQRLGVAGTASDGVGLGLAVSRRLIEAMGGTISLESRPGEGSTFFVRLADGTAPGSPA